MHRRSFLLGLAAMGLCPARVMAAASPEVLHVASLDYALTETLLAMDTTPFAQSNVEDWAEWVVAPALPRDVIEIGAAISPNMELLALLKPDRFLITPYLDLLRPSLERIAPTSRIGIYDAEPGDPFTKALSAVDQLGALLSREAAAADLLAWANTLFASCAARIARLPRAPLPLKLVSFIDARHVWVYGKTSLFQGVLDRLGLENGWREDANYWGFSAIGVERLADPRPARIVGLQPVPVDVLPTLQRSPLWRELPPVRAGELSILPTVLRFGGLPSAMRLAELLTTDLERAAA